MDDQSQDPKDNGISADALILVRFSLNLSHLDIYNKVNLCNKTLF